MVQLNYFGDTRDYFKYDLITVVLKRLEFSSYVFVPLLTVPRNNNEGKKQSYDDRNSDLRSFIAECKGKSLPSLTHWERWLKRYINTYQTVEPVNDKFFKNDERDQYWAEFHPILKSDHSLLNNLTPAEYAKTSAVL